jgi:hypothetical protein
MEAELPLRMAPWAAKYAHLTDPEAPHLIRELAIAQLRVEQCQSTLAAAEAANFQRSSAVRKNAADFAAAELFARLTKKPERTVLKLKETSAGVARLLRAWTSLDRRSILLPWSEASLEHTLDLLGLEANERFTHPDAEDLKIATITLLSTGERNACTHAEQTIRALIALQIESLQSLAQDLADQDAALAALADSGHDLDPPPQILTLRRYETANRRIYEKSVARLESLAATQAEAENDSEPVSEPSLTSKSDCRSIPAAPPPSSFGNPADTASRVPASHPTRSATLRVPALT